ncbi:MAG TPA: alpha-L-fucosidase [Rectinema sp.]|nr:alpha-L-fucosidase [Rectinema sp.]
MGTHKNERNKRISWFQDARFGMFIHWGLYSIPAKGEWIQSAEKISAEEYEKYAQHFKPDFFDPSEWARLAKRAGMKYAVFTAKHHDGFCLFDSKTTNFKSTACPAGKDFVKEYLEAFRKEGIKAGLYYSLLDWHHPDYPHFGDRHHPMRDNEAYRNRHHEFSRYLDYMHEQVRELCTNYGDIPLLWFDFSYDKMSGEMWRAKDLIKMVRSLQPNTIINNRLEASGESLGSLVLEDPPEYVGDFASPEQIIPKNGFLDNENNPIPWEACLTMNNHWGYVASDSTWKTSEQLIHKIVECVSKGGNMILNVGPDARGQIPKQSESILNEIGDWMQKNEASVHGCGAAGIEKPEWGWYTRQGENLYAHVLEAPIGPLYLSGLKDYNIKRMCLLRDESELRIASAWNTSLFPAEKFISLAEPPEFSYPLPDPRDTVIKIELL